MALRYNSGGYKNLDQMISVVELVQARAGLPDLLLQVISLSREIQDQSKTGLPGLFGSTGHGMLCSELEPRELVK